MTILIDPNVSDMIDVIPASFACDLAALLRILCAIPKIITPLIGITKMAIAANLGLIINNSDRKARILIGSTNNF